MRARFLFGAASAALLAFGAAPAASAQDGDPPGDSSTRSRFTAGQSLSGEIAPEADVDWYRMRVEEGMTYAFTLDGVPDDEGNALDPMLGLYSSDGSQLAFNDDSGGSLNSALQYTPSRSGDIFVEARAFSESGTGPYQLNAVATAAPEDDVGNDAGTRARINPGRDVNGSIDYEGDVDWYRLNARSGYVYRIALNGAENGLNDPFLRVIDADGGDLAINDDSNESLNSYLEFVPQSSAAVFIEARAYADAGVGAYTLRVEGERLPDDGASSDTRTRGRITAGQSITSSLDYPNDRDWYRIRLEEGESYRFAMVSAGDDALGDPLIRLYDSNGEEVAMDDDGGQGLNSYLEFTAPSTGNYFVEARGFSDDATGGYTLSAAEGDIPADASTDVSLDPNGDYRWGALSPAGDRDWYRLDLEEGQGARIGLENAGDAEAPGLDDPYLALYGADGVQLAYDDDGGEGLNSWLEFQAPAAGAYYVEVRGYSEDAQGRYALSLTAGEIGDSPDGAEYLDLNNQGRISLIGADGDVDWFAINAIEGRPYRIYLYGADTDGLADPMLRLYDAQGNEVAADDDGGGGLNSYITYVAPSTGPIYAAASSFGGVGTGRYVLRASDSDVPGSFNTDEYIDASGDERISRIDMPGDYDYWGVQLEEGVRYAIELNATGDSPLPDPVLAVMDASDTEVASDNDSGPGRNARLTFTPETSGTFYLRAGGRTNGIGWYQISIVRQ